ncbi:MAG: XdhC family protein [Proteocatella sp.]
MKSNFYQRILKEIEHDDSSQAYILTITDGKNIGSKLFIRQGSNGITDFDITYEDSSLKPYWQDVLSIVQLEKAPYLESTMGIFVESLNPKVQVVVCGGGHVSLALSRLCDFMGYELTVLEDRQEFGNHQKFPNARRIIVDSFESIFKNNSFDKNSCFVIATRGHLCDSVCLENIMELDFCYAGMIGSKRKIAKTKELMISKGFSQEQFNLIKTPIGLPIGGQTPEEIAVSIIAEIIQHINLTSRSYFSDILKNALMSENDNMVIAKIISKSGSSPRGIGSQMIIKKDASIIDTIGGGMIEFSAINEALNILNQEAPASSIKHYILNNEEAASLGMWCGGNIDIFFDTI